MKKKTRTKDEVLKKVGMQSSLDSHDFKHVEELEQKGLIRKNSEGYLYSLTSYGSIVQVMGYTNYEKAETLEKELPSFTPTKIKQNKVIILVFFFSALLGIIILLWNS